MILSAGDTKTPQLSRNFPLTNPWVKWLWDDFPGKLKKKNSSKDITVWVNGVLATTYTNESSSFLGALDDSKGTCNKTDEFWHTFLHRLLGIFGDFGIWRQSLFHDTAYICNGKKTILLPDWCILVVTPARFIVWMRTAVRWAWLLLLPVAIGHLLALVLLPLHSPSLLFLRRSCFLLVSLPPSFLPLPVSWTSKP